MSSEKNKYYSLDDQHFVGNTRMPKKQRDELDKKTKDFFAKRRTGAVKKKKAEKA